MDYKTVLWDIEEGGLGIIRLNRPESHNALSILMREEIQQILENQALNDDVRLVIISGTGKSFSAGFDLDEFARPELMKDIYRSSASYHRAVWRYPKPLIAAVNGAALGGGFDLATLCDIRIAHSSASFGHPEIRFGACPLYTPLRWIVGLGQARELCFSARRIMAAEALAMGLVSLTTEDDALEFSRQYARDLLKAPQRILTQTKAYMLAASAQEFEQSFILEHDQPFELVLAKMSRSKQKPPDYGN